MPNYQYKVVPFIGKVSAKQGASDVAQQLQGIINQHADQGWEFHTFNDVNIEVASGCLGGLLGAKSEYMRFDQLVFRAVQGE